MTLDELQIPPTQIEQATLIEAISEVPKLRDIARRMAFQLDRKEMTRKEILILLRSLIEVSYLRINMSPDDWSGLTGDHVVNQSRLLEAIDTELEKCTP